MLMACMIMVYVSMSNYNYEHISLQDNGYPDNRVYHRGDLSLT